MVMAGEESPYFILMDTPYHPSPDLTEQFAQWIQCGEYDKIASVGAKLSVNTQQVSYWVATVLSALGHAASVQPPVVKRWWNGRVYNYRIVSDLPFAIDMASGIVFDTNQTGCEAAVVNDDGVLYLDSDVVCTEYNEDGFRDVVRVYYGNEADFKSLFYALRYAASHPDKLHLPIGGVVS